jgi:hypothetical protein
LNTETNHAADNARVPLLWSLDPYRKLVFQSGEEFGITIAASLGNKKTKTIFRLANIEWK